MTDGSNGDLVRELRSAAEWHRIEHDGNLDDSTAPLRAATALEAQAERISVLERALEPFAARAGKLDGKWLDHETQWSPAYGNTAITIGDLRRARTTLTGAR